MLLASNGDLPSLKLTQKSKHQRGGDIHATNEKSESENPILHDFKGD